MRVLAALIASVLIGLVGVTSSIRPASATYYPNGMPTQSFRALAATVYPTQWFTAIAAGKDSWNSHPSFPGYLSPALGCANKVQVGTFGMGYMGLHIPITASSFTINLDSSEINSYVSSNGYSFANVAKSTMAHELGHALCLGHTTSVTLLMTHARNKNVVTGPATSEVLESNSYYAGGKQCA